LYSAIGYQQYSLRAVGSMRAVTAQQHSPLTTFLGAGIGVAVTLIAVAGWHQVGKRRRSTGPDERRDVHEEAVSVPAANP
ncbi:polymerase, partial [Mycobacterium sp. ITM-2017-0098]